MGIIKKIASTKNEVGVTATKNLVPRPEKEASSEMSNFSITIKRPAGMEYNIDDENDDGAGIWVLPSPKRMFQDDTPFKWLYMESNRPILVRKSDRDICEDVISTIKENNPLVRGTIITGTSGIGTSVLTNWLLAAIRSFFPERDIFIYDAGKQHRSLIKSGGRCYELVDSQYRDSVERDVKSIVLIDIGCSTPIKNYNYAGYVVVTSSTDKIPERINENPRFCIRFLTVWSWEEAKAGYLIWKYNGGPIPKSEQILEEEFKGLRARYNIVGGVAKYLFCDDATTALYEKEFHNAIWLSVREFDHHVSLFENNHKVLHLHARENICNYEYKFASEEVQRRFVEESEDTTTEQKLSIMYELVTKNLDEAVAQSLVGILFARMVHKELPTSFENIQDRIQWINTGPKLLSSGELKTTWEYTKFKERMKKGCEERVYYISKNKRQTVVDSWMKEGSMVWVFQITIAKTRRSEIDVLHHFINKIRKEYEAIENTVCFTWYQKKMESVFQNKCGWFEKYESWENCPFSISSKLRDETE